MPTWTLILAGLNSIVFLAWVVMMFRTLFAQRRRAAARTGKTFPGVRDALAEWRHWWRSPEWAFERRLLIGLTCVLVVIVVLMAVLAG